MLSPFTGPRIEPRIQFNIETSVPTCGEYPSRGPKIFGPASAASAAGAPVGKKTVAALRPQTIAPERLRKLLRFISIFVLMRIAIMHNFAWAGTT